MILRSAWRSGLTALLAVALLLAPHSGRAAGAEPTTESSSAATARPATTEAATPASDAFAIHRTDVPATPARDGVAIAYAPENRK